MRTFPNFPTESVCIICKTNHNSECWLVPVDGTEEDDNVEAMPVHVACTGQQMSGMRYNKEHNIIYCYLG